MTPDVTHLTGRLLDVLALADQPRQDIADSLVMSRNQVRAHLSDLVRAGLWSPEAGETRVCLGVHPFAALFPLVEAEGIADLAADIRTNGLNEKIVIFGDLAAPSILDGRNRCAALRAAGLVDPPDAGRVSQIARYFRFFGPGEGSPLAFVISRNLMRRHLTDSQRAMSAARIATFKPGNPAHVRDSGMTQAEAAAALKISERAVQKARVVIEHGGDDLANRVARGGVRVSAAETVARAGADVREMTDAEIKAAAKRLREGEQAFKAERRAQRERDLAARIAAGNADLAAAGEAGRRYGVILADPEWQFVPFSIATGMDRAADNHYPTTALGVIKARPVAEVAARDCVLFLWATAPMLPEALDVMAAWGFAYKSHLVWDKVHSGTGYWFRNRHELLLVGTRGDVPAPGMGTQGPSILTEARTEHSVKPGCVFPLIERWFPNLPKLEMNARRARPGWDVWGAEAPETVKTPQNGD